MTGEAPAERRVFFVVGEASGDALAASLVDALREMQGETIRFEGLAGEQLAARGIDSLFDIEDIAVMGLGPVIARLPLIVRRLSQTVEAILDSGPDLVVVIDSPDFCHRVARRVRKAAPGIPIIGWVSPSVWAWRPGRAAAMRAFIDELLVLLPFEVEAHARLGGPPATYVGHPLMAQRGALLPSDDENRPTLGEGALPVLLVLPGSRRGEITRHMALMGDTVERVARLMPERAEAPFDLILPAVPRHAELVRALADRWPIPPQVVVGDEAKKDAFARAHAALAASGTVTLELALAGVPMVVVYRLDWLANIFRRIVKVWTIVLPNLVLGRPVVREYVGEYARPEALARALAALAQDTPERHAQVEAFAELAAIMGTGSTPAARAADVVVRVLARSDPEKGTCA